MDRNEMINNLKEGVCEVVFTKVNGDKRTMLCTLSSEVLPEAVTSTSTPTTVNEEVVKCFDVEAKGWRSYRVDSVISFEPCCTTNELTQGM